MTNRHQICSVFHLNNNNNKWFPFIQPHDKYRTNRLPIFDSFFFCRFFFSPVNFQLLFSFCFEMFFPIKYRFVAANVNNPTDFQRGRGKMWKKKNENIEVDTKKKLS